MLPKWSLPLNVAYMSHYSHAYYNSTHLTIHLIILTSGEEITLKSLHALNGENLIY
jgi:hypothetical protein